MPQTFVPKMRNWKTGVSRRGIEVFDQVSQALHLEGISLLSLDVVNYLVFRLVHVCIF